MEAFLEATLKGNGDCWVCRAIYFSWLRFLFGDLTFIQPSFNILPKWSDQQTQSPKLGNKLVPLHKLPNWPKIELAISASASIYSKVRALTLG